ncbi:terpene synthase family protein [Nocardia grenadensis]|uniref:terpene synthase family protein n=1 Tax=Nocardia grenadensis TaxID=931537 RepID=UPI003D70D4C0
MKQDLEFDVPFAAYINPRLARVLPSHMDWLRAFDLLPAVGAEEEYLDWDFPSLSAWWWPNAEDEQLRLGLDIFGWLVIFDGQFDRSRGTDIDHATEFVNELVHIARHPEDPLPGYASPAAAAFKDVWDRERADMLPHWQRRAALNWSKLFESVVAETKNRVGSRIPDKVEYDRVRDDSGLMYVLLDASELICDCKVSLAVQKSPELQRMRLATVRGCNYIQDLFSVNKEEIQDDPNNIVFVLGNQNTLTRSESYRAAVALVREITDDFLRAEARIPRMLDRLGASVEDRKATYFLVDNMRANFAAAYEWTRNSNRYTSSARTREEQPGFLGDVGTRRLIS